MGRTVDVLHGRPWSTAAAFGATARWRLSPENRSRWVNVRSDMQPAAPEINGLAGSVGLALARRTQGRHATLEADGDERSKKRWFVGITRIRLRLRDGSCG